MDLVIAGIADMLVTFHTPRMKGRKQTSKGRRAAKASRPSRLPRRASNDNRPIRHASNDNPSARRAAPHGEQNRVRFTVNVAPDELEWLQEQARKRGLSMSATFSDVLRLGMRDAAWERCFAAIGDTEPLTDEERAQFDAEFREAGLLP